MPSHCNLSIVAMKIPWKYLEILWFLKNKIVKRNALFYLNNFIRIRALNFINTLWTTQEANSKIRCLKHHWICKNNTDNVWAAELVPCSWCQNLGASNMHKFHTLKTNSFHSFIKFHNLKANLIDLKDSINPSLFLPIVECAREDYNLK